MTIVQRTGGWLAAWALALFVWLVPAPAEAHWADLAVAEVLVEKNHAVMTLTLPTGLVGEADKDGNGRLSAQEVQAHRVWLSQTLGASVRLLADGRPARLAVEPAAAQSLPEMPGSSDRHTTLQLRYAWESPRANLALEYGLFVPGVSTASCLATVVTADATKTLVFTPEHTRHALGETAPWAALMGFVALGVEHIWLGYDHVLFLIALLMMGGGLGYLLKVVTAFTVAHSLTLALATFNLVALPGRLVESAIALSIVYVAAEIFWRRDLKGRWVITLLFGLVHGLGFASVLKELDVAGGNLAASLVGFNIGVELGQLAIVAAAYLVLRFVRRQSWDLRFRQVVSAGVAAMGLIWFVERAFLA